MMKMHNFSLRVILALIVSNLAVAADFKQTDPVNEDCPLFVSFYFDGSYEPGYFIHALFQFRGDTRKIDVLNMDGFVEEGGLGEFRNTTLLASGITSNGQPYWERVEMVYDSTYEELEEGEPGDGDIDASDWEGNGSLYVKFEEIVPEGHIPNRGKLACTEAHYQETDIASETEQEF